MAFGIHISIVFSDLQFPLIAIFALYARFGKRRCLCFLTFNIWMATNGNPKRYPHVKPTIQFETDCNFSIRWFR
jgi:hypothetical protein